MTLANLPPLGQKKPKAKPNPKRLNRVKMLPCVICGSSPCDAHHLCCGRYSQSKASDDETIPLCKLHHQVGPDAIHNGKESWVEKFGQDYEYLPLVNRLLGDGG